MGSGCLKLERGKRPEVLQLMRRFKALLDPKGILNPYKMVDAGDAGCHRP
jgi:FAD/FMN-containing dehydrogenase